MLETSPSLRNSGFTLIEVLISMIVLVGGLVAAAAVFAYATSTAHRAERQSLAAFLVQGKIEQLRTLAPDRLPPGGSLDGLSPDSDYSEYMITTRGTRARVTLNPAEADLLRVWRIDGTNPVRISVAVYSMNTMLATPNTPLAFGSTSRARRL